MVGVAIVGRPVSRHLDDGWTAEVIVADQTEPVRRALRLLERRAEGEHDRLEALGLRLLEEADALQPQEPQG